MYVKYNPNESFIMFFSIYLIINFLEVGMEIWDGAFCFAGSGRGGSIHYSITSGDPAGLFTIDPALGVLRTAAELDHERQAGVLLNVQAAWPGAARAHTQVSTFIQCSMINETYFCTLLTRNIALNSSRLAMLFEERNKIFFFFIWTSKMNSVRIFCKKADKREPGVP